MVVLCVETPMLTNMLSQRQNCNWNGWVNILSLMLKTHLLHRNYNHRNLSCTGFYVSTIIYPKGPFSSVNKLFHRNFLEILLMTFSLYLPYCGSLQYMGVQFPITKCKSKYPMDQCSTVTTNMSQCFFTVARKVPQDSSRHFPNFLLEWSSSFSTATNQRMEESYKGDGHSSSIHRILL